MMRSKRIWMGASLMLGAALCQAAQAESDRYVTLTQLEYELFDQFVEKEARALGEANEVGAVDADHFLQECHRPVVNGEQKVLPHECAEPLWNQRIVDNAAARQRKEQVVVEAANARVRTAFERVVQQHRVDQVESREQRAGSVGISGDIQVEPEVVTFRGGRPEAINARGALGLVLEVELDEAKHVAHGSGGRRGGIGFLAHARSLAGGDAMASASRYAGDKLTAHDPLPSLRAMSSHPTDFHGSVVDALREAIESQIPDSKAEVTGGGGHFSIDVESPAFAGKNMLQSQRLVYGAITHLMSGDMAPVHAVDSLTTRVPKA